MLPGIGSNVPHWFNRPLTHITPLSLSDGATYERKLDWVYRYIVDWLVPQLDGKLDEWFAQYKVDHAALLKDISDEKTRWQDLFDAFMADVVAQLEALNDQAAANLVANKSSKLRVALDAVFVDHDELSAFDATIRAYVNAQDTSLKEYADGKIADLSNATVKKNSLVFNVVDFGAKGDGVTLDSAAVQAAVDAAAVKGGVVYFPPGTFKINNVTLRSNIVFTGEGIITSTTYNVFRALSGSAKGYGASVKNVAFVGITFKGDFNKDDNAVAITLHHAENVVFERCNWIDAILGGHAIDLAGCKNIVVRDSVFQGFNPPVGREYAEAIQVDHSTAQGISNMDNAASYDGLPCLNVSVTGCKFIPSYYGVTKFLAPNPIGSHATLTVNHKNILFADNVLEDHLASRDFSSITSPVHFQGVENLSIVNNIFNGSGDPSSVIKILNFTTGIAPGDVANPNPSNASALSNKASRSILVEGNRFSGYSSLENKGLVIVSGSTNGNLRPDDVRVVGNSFVDCAPNQNGNVGSNPIAISTCDRVEVSRNIAKNVRSLLFATNIWNLCVSENSVDDAKWVAVAIDGASDKEMVNVTVGNNIFTACGSTIYLNYAHGASVMGNVISDAKSGTSFAGYANGNITVASSRAVALTSNIVRASDPVNTGGAIQFVRTSSASLAANNITRGWTTGVLVESGSTVTTSGNLN